MDLFIFQQINQFALKWFWLDTLAIFFAKYFEYILIFLLFSFLFWPSKTKKQKGVGETGCFPVSEDSERSECQKPRVSGERSEANKVSASRRLEKRSDFLFKNLKKYWPMVIQAFLAAILARFIIVEIIRYFLPRPRPFLEIPVNLLLEPLNQASFPSGHAAFYFALSTVVFLYLKKVYPPSKFWWGAGILFFTASFLISLSRVFSGIHWPSDILAGALIGILSGIFILLSSQKFFSVVKKQSPQ